MSDPARIVARRIAPTPGGDPLEAIMLFIDTDDESTSRLIMFQDTGITGMPLTPDGNNVQIVVGANGWFTL